MLKELMKKVEQGTECRGFNIGILLGKEAVKLFKEEMNSTRSFPEESELVVCMNFRFKPSP